MQDDKSIPQDFQEQLANLTPEQQEATRAAFDAFTYNSQQDAHEQTTHKCPITGEDTPTYDMRFPNTVAHNASIRAIDAQGRPVAFYNASLGGGIFARHTNADGSYEDNSDVACWIDNIACKGVEFHMGGVGIVPLVQINYKTYCKISPHPVL